MKQCKNCKNDFEPKSQKAEFCSPKCRVYFNREKKEKEIEKNMQLYGTPGVPIDLKNNATEIVKEVEGMLKSEPKKYETIQSKDENGKMMIKTNDPKTIEYLNNISIKSKDFAVQYPNGNILSSEDKPIQKNPVWVEEIEEICNKEGITPDEMIRQWKEMNGKINTIYTPLNFNDKSHKKAKEKIVMENTIILDEAGQMASIPTAGLSKHQLDIRKKKLGY